MSNIIFNARIDILNSVSTIDPTEFDITANLFDGTGQFGAADVLVGDTIFLDTFPSITATNTISKYRVILITGAVGLSLSAKIKYADSGSPVDPSEIIGNPGFICRRSPNLKLAWHAAPTIHTISDYLVQYARDEEDWEIIDNLGATGPQGLQGATGFGIQGATGLAGVGVTGPSGIGGTGVQGVTGLGVQGVTGLAGNGATGIRGATGLGIQGATGLAGAGTTGIQGFTGSQGATGVATGAEVVRNIKFFSDYVIVRCSGTQTDINNLTAAKDFTIAGESGLILTVPSGVQVLEICGTFVSTETGGRSTIRVEMADPAGSTDLLKTLRPFAVRYNASGGIGGTASVQSNVAGTLVVKISGYGAGGENQQFAVLF